MDRDHAKPLPWKFQMMRKGVRGRGLRAVFGVELELCLSQIGKALLIIFADDN